MGDLTRINKNNEKKTRSVAAALITPDMINNTDAMELFMLPVRSLITAAYIVREVAANAITLDVGFSGGQELFNDAALNATGVLSTNTLALTGNAESVTPGIALQTTTGKTVTLKASGDMTAGRFYVIVEFIEFTLGNGNLMDYSEE